MPRRTRRVKWSPLLGCPGAACSLTLDGEPVHIFFLLVAPPDAAGLHLKALARISRLLKDKFFRQSLRETKTAAEILKTHSRTKTNSKMTTLLVADLLREKETDLELTLLAGSEGLAPGDHRF